MCCQRCLCVCQQDNRKKKASAPNHISQLGEGEWKGSVQRWSKQNQLHFGSDSDQSLKLEDKALALVKDCILQAAFVYSDIFLLVWPLTTDFLQSLESLKHRIDWTLGSSENINPEMLNH